MATRPVSSFPNLLPATALAWMSRRLMEALGVTCLAVAGWFILALVTFDVADPSLNYVTDGPVLNLAGAPGATVAEAILTFTGLAGLLPVVVLIAWARSLIIRHRLSRPVWRALAILAATLLSMPALAATPASEWFVAGAGGIGGTLMVTWAAQTLGVSLATAQDYALALHVPALAALVFAAAVPWADVRLAWRLCRAAAHGLTRLKQKIALWRADGSEPATLGDAVPDFPIPRGDLSRRPTRKKSRKKGSGTAERRKPAGNRRPAPRKNQRHDGTFELPPRELLVNVDSSRRREVNRSALVEKARMLEEVLSDFGIRGHIEDVREGPVVTLYELEPDAGIRASRIIGLADDIARNMSAVSARVAVVPGRTVLGIELPNDDRETVVLRELLETRAFTRTDVRLPIALGKQISGTPVIEDLANMPHLLVAGTTGSGKSVAVNAMILSLLYRLSPDECRLILIDPKMLELSVYDDIPHLLAPVVTEPHKAVMALKWVVGEMEKRYRGMQKIGVRNIEGFNARVAAALAEGTALTRTVQTGFDARTGDPCFEEEVIADRPLPFIVVVVDEMADLMLVAGRDIEGAIQRLSQMARAAGIHLIMATQRPSVDVITGTIKANFPCRVSFNVTSKIDSRTIIGDQGAEQLLGKGDMLFLRGGGRLTRIHGPFVSDEEVREVVAYLRTQGTPDYLDTITEEPLDAGDALPDMAAGGAPDKNRALYDRAVFIVTKEQKASTSFIQRHLQIGYNRAASIIEQMEKSGVVSAANHVGKREVLANPPPGDD
ncbi:MAG: DNA translocase FtsK 4TM domain-containing protein [Alphaproteobacteria bacterium]|nr:DNA translocase FtsK 4TM domain-containing protein [Alphaproteobacteria bacterium]